MQQNTNTPRRPRPPGWLTREELAVKRGMGISNIDQMTAAGKLPPPYAFSSRCVLYSEEEVEVYERLAQQNAAAAEEAKTAARAAAREAAREARRTKVSA
jgi:predicted DNA-binding transcriptional regulator AlpA